jgi:hypothetical protein
MTISTDNINNSMYKLWNILKDVLLIYSKVNTKWSSIEVALQQDVSLSMRLVVIVFFV